MPVIIVVICQAGAGAWHFIHNFLNDRFPPQEPGLRLQLFRKNRLVKALAFSLTIGCLVRPRAGAKKVSGDEAAEQSIAAHLGAAIILAVALFVFQSTGRPLLARTHRYWLVE